MFEGSLVYKTDDHIYKYTVYGTDNSQQMSLIVTSGSENALEFMDQSKSEEIGISKWTKSERRVDIGLANVKTEVNKHLDVEKNKRVKDTVNNNFFCHMAAIIRFAKNNCTKYNEKNNLAGLALADGTFEVVPKVDYEIAYPTEKDRIFAKVTLEYGDVVAMHIESPILDVDFKPSYETPKLFTSIKDGWRRGIGFDADYLGFALPEQKLVEIQDTSGMYSNIEEIIAAHPDKNFSWLLGKDYRIVTDENLDEVCNYIMKWDGKVFYDTETTGLNINFMSREGKADQMVGIVLSVKFGESFYFPCQMKSIKNLCGGDHRYFMERYMKPILETKQLVAHNMAFDWKVAYIYNINANIVDDTMAILLLTLSADHKNYPVGLKENAKRLLGRDSLELSDLVKNNEWGENSDIKFWDLPYELVRLYACADTDNTNGLLGYAEETQLLDKYNARKIYDIEIAFSYAVAYQEFYGHRMNLQNIANVRAEIQTNQDRNYNLMKEIAGHDFNPNSSKELIKIMYKELGMPEQRNRQSGNLTTDKEALKYLAELTNENDEPKYPFAKYLQDYKIDEAVRKVIDKLPEHMTKDGFIFSTVMQYGTTTGRVSINNPNYQSYNDAVKKNVIPREGFWMFDTDYSSVEYRVLGNMVGNERIMKSFEDPDFDYHQYQAAHMYNVPYSAVTKKLRKAAKGINFGLPYGMGDQSLGIRVFGEESEENTRKAAALRAAYFKGQEDIRDWFEQHRNNGVKRGYTETFFGRRRYYHPEDFTEAKIRRQAGNQVIQGTAADIYKLAVGRVFKRICKEGWLGKVIFTGFIHDELMGEVSNDINPAVFLKVLREEYEVKVHNDDGSPWCPLYMGFGYGMSWYEAKSTEIPIKLQWEIVDKYGNNGFPDWNGDGRKFCDKVPDMLRDFDVRDIRNQILDVEAQGKEIKPTLNNQVIDCCATDEKVFPKACQEFLELNGQTDDSFILTNLKDFIKYIDDKYHIQGIMTDAEGKLIKEFNVSKTKETQKCLDVYCKLHAVDRNKVNLLDIPDYDQTKQATQDAEAEMLGADYFKEDETTTEEKHLENRKVHLRMLGYDWDIQEKRLYIYLMPYAFNEQLLKFANDKGDGYQIFVYVPDKEEPQAVPRYIPHNSTTEQIVRTICVMYVNSLHSS